MTRVCLMDHFFPLPALQLVRLNSALEPQAEVVEARQGLPARSAGYAA